MKNVAQKMRAFAMMSELAGWRGALGFTVAHLRGAPRFDLTLRPQNYPLTIRPRNSDFDVMIQTFIRDGCDVIAFARDARIVVDAGANIGLTALKFHWQYPEARIIAIEPEDENFALLRKNTAAIPQVAPVRAALWPRKTSVNVRRVSDRSWDFQTREVEAVDSEPKCDTITLDDIIGEHGRIDVLKLDIEGAEWPLFEETDLSWLDRTGIAIVEFHGADVDERLAKALRGRQVRTVCQHEKHILIPQ